MHADFLPFLPLRLCASAVKHTFSLIQKQWNADKTENTDAR